MAIAVIYGAIVYQRQLIPAQDLAGTNLRRAVPEVGDQHPC